MAFVAKTYDFNTAFRMAVVGKNPDYVDDILTDFEITSVDHISDNVSIVTVTWDRPEVKFWCESVELSGEIYMKVTELFTEEK